MQPYFFPYIGYFQLINSVDKFIVFDDVNYINKGWINRNNLLMNGSASLVTVPLKDASQNKKINEHQIVTDQVWKTKLLKTIEQSYKKAPYYSSVFELIRDSILTEENNLARFNTIQIKNVCRYLGVKTEIIESSKIYKNAELKGQDRILDICLQEMADVYINPIGGLDLYNKSLFEKKNIKLFFIKSDPIIYTQFKNTFVPWLSMIDVLMFNSREEVIDLLNKKELISN